MQKEKFLELINQIEEEKYKPTIKTVDKCIAVSENYFSVIEKEKQEFLKENKLSEFNKVNKRRVDYLTWKFSQLIFDELSEKKENLKVVIKGYQSLAKLNGIDLEYEDVKGNIDFIHTGEDFSLFTRLAELSSRLGREEEAKMYQRKEEKRKGRLEESEKVFREGIKKHEDWQINEAISKYKESLEINPYNTKTRAMLGFTYSTTIILEHLFKEPNKEMFYYPPEEFGGISLWEVKENNSSFEISLGVNFQEQYYNKIEPEDLKIIFTCEKFGESNNRVFRYVRDFSDELKKFMVDYSQILKRSAFKFYKRKDAKEKDPYSLETEGLIYFSKIKGIKISKIERKARRDECPFLELGLIEGQSMYDLFRELETSFYDKVFKEGIEDALINKHLRDLAIIQNQTLKIKEKIDGSVFEKSDYQKKLREAFEEKDGGLVILLKKYFGLELTYPEVLDGLGKELNRRVADESDLVLYKDASPRNTKINFRGILKELGLENELKKENKKIEETIDFIYKRRKELDLEKIGPAFANNLYQLDFEKINQISSEFDDLIEIIEFPFFNPEKWEEKYKYFLRLKGKEDKAKELKEEYFLFSLNRNIRWLYYLMKWYNRPNQEEDKKRQHLEDLRAHIGNTHRAIDELNRFGYNFGEVGKMLEEIKGKTKNV